jgi:drug/metabolite transporter (DMT)-like permease
VIGLYSSFAFLLCALLFTAVGQLLFRMYYVRTKKKYLITAIGMFLSVPFFSYFALLNFTLAFVYMSTALIHVLVLIMSHLFLKEQLTRKKYASMLFIVIGILIFNFR